MASEDFIRKISDEEIKKALRDPLSFPPSYKDWIIKWVEQEARIEKHNLGPITFGTTSVQFDTDAAIIDPLAATFTYTGVGISNLDDGTYVVIIGATNGIWFPSE